MATHVYIDFDGVYNALCTGDYPSFNTGWSAESYKRFRINGYTLKVSTELVEALNALAAREDVVFHWLTTWEHDAAEKVSPEIGINGQEWEVHTHEHAGIDLFDWKNWWKLAIIRSELHRLPAGDKVVWIDDDIAHQADAAHWLRSIEGIVDLFAVVPFSAVGVTTEEVDAIIDFIDGRIDDTDPDEDLVLEA